MTASPSCPLDPKLADVNGDGKLDIVVGGYCGGSVYVFKGNGDGTFQAYSSVASATSVFTLTVGDFNGDGKLDIAAPSESSSNSLHILLGNGDGTFQSALNSTPMTSPFAVLAGDFNNDGKLDILLMSRSGQGISLVLGNGDGTFQSPQVVGNGSYYGFDAGDLSGDGKLDIAAITSSGVVQTWFGNADGTFQTPQSVGSTGGISYGVVLGNFATGGGLGVASSDGASAIKIFLQTVSLSPSSQNFGTVSIGSSSPSQTFTITNSTANTVHISGISFTGTNAGDFSETDTCSSPIASSGTCTINVTFTPGGSGSRSATLSVADDGAIQPAERELNGNGSRRADRSAFFLAALVRQSEQWQHEQLPIFDRHEQRECFPDEHRHQPHRNQ